MGEYSNEILFDLDKIRFDEDRIATFDMGNGNFIYSTYYDTKSAITNSGKTFLVDSLSSVSSEFSSKTDTYSIANFSVENVIDLFSHITNNYSFIVDTGALNWIEKPEGALLSIVYGNDVVHVYEYYNNESGIETLYQPTEISTGAEKYSYDSKNIDENRSFVLFVDKDTADSIVDLFENSINGMENEFRIYESIGQYIVHYCMMVSPVLNYSENEGMYTVQLDVLTDRK